MGVGRKRKTNKDLPQRVYLRNGTYWWVHPSGKWHKLGRTKAEMYAALAQRQRSALRIEWWAV